MQSTAVRLIVLLAVLAAGNLLLATLGTSPLVGQARWPVEDDVYSAAGWTVSAPRVTEAHGVQFVTREYRRDGGVGVILDVATSPEAKRVYKAGADVPFLGSGFVIGPAPDLPAQLPSGMGAMSAQRGTQAYVVFHASGERRGLIGSQFARWALVGWDAALHRPNDYYRISLTVPVRRVDTADVGVAYDLAATVFARIAAWYAG